MKQTSKEVEATLRLRCNNYYAKAHSSLLKETIVSITLGKRDLKKKIVVYKQAQLEIEKAKNRAEKATQLKDKFVSMVAHDLKSPFTSILGTLRLLFANKDGAMPEDKLELINRCISNGNNLVDLIDKLLDTERLKSGKIKPNKSFLDLNRLVESVISRLNMLADGKSVALLNKVPQGVRIYVDKDLYKEVVLNLISNGIKFTHSGGTVAISHEEGKDITIAIADNGVGIKDSMVPSILDVNSKKSSIGTDGEKGTGLGLIFCQEIIKAHDGNIEFESKVGKGTTFRVTVPYTAPRVLLVDDEPSVRHACKMMMKKIGAEVFEAGTAKEALELVKESLLPHLILTDIHLPGGLNGLDLFTTIREKKGLENCPVIVMTGEITSNSHEKAMRLGADDFMNKPVFENELVSRVRRFIA